MVLAPLASIVRRHPHGDVGQLRAADGGRKLARDAAVDRTVGSLSSDPGLALAGARRGQLVPQGGDLFLGGAVCQVHMTILPESGPVYKHDHTRQRSIPVTPRPRAALSRRACASQVLPAASKPAPPSW